MKAYAFAYAEAPTFDCDACQESHDAKKIMAFRFRKGATIHGDLVDTLVFCTPECAEDYENSLKP